ncbi:MAG: 30S ribosomal protein S6 [Planctomycetota bacterium]
MKQYEGMFVVHNKEGRKELDYLQELVSGLITKCGGQIASIEKWDERKLAYDIDGHSQGIYYLAYFTGDSETVQKLRHECRLSDTVLRALFLAIDKIATPEDVRKQSGRVPRVEPEAVEVGAPGAPDEPDVEGDETVS